MGAWMMASFSFMKVLWCVSFHSNFTSIQVNIVSGFAILTKFLMNFL